MKFDIIGHHFMLEFVDSGLYFVQDENNFIHPLLQVVSDEKVSDPDPPVEVRGLLTLAIYILCNNKKILS